MILNLQYAFGSFAHFLERIGGAAGEIFGFFTGAPPLPMIDPQTGQKLPLPSPEEIKAERRRRLINWLVGSIILYFGYRTVKYLVLRMRKPKSPTHLMMDRQWDQQVNRHGKDIRPQMPMGNGIYVNNSPGDNIYERTAYGPRLGSVNNSSEHMYNKLDYIFR